MTIFIYQKLEQPSLQKHHSILKRMECMVVNILCVETVNDGRDSPKRQGYEGITDVMQTENEEPFRTLQLPRSVGSGLAHGAGACGLRLT
jgi:hypothetical protein